MNQLVGNPGVIDKTVSPVWIIPEGGNGIPDFFTHQFVADENGVHFVCNGNPVLSLAVYKNENRNLILKVHVSPRVRAEISSAAVKPVRSVIGIIRKPCDLLQSVDKKIHLNREISGEIEIFVQKQEVFLAFNITESRCQEMVVLISGQLDAISAVGLGNIVIIDCLFGRRDGDLRRGYSCGKLRRVRGGSRRSRCRHCRRCSWCFVCILLRVAGNCKKHCEKDDDTKCFSLHRITSQCSSFLICSK